MVDAVLVSYDSGTPWECVHCGSRHDREDDFIYRGFHFCIMCMGMLISWYLDNGTHEAPEIFDYVDSDTDLVT